MVFDENNSLYVGGAFHHLNRANQSFDSDGKDLLYSRYTAHAGGEFMINERFGLVPGVIVMTQGPSFQVNAGSNVKFLLDGGRNSATQSFQVGLWTRISNRLDSSVLTDALILSTRFDYENFALGFSYDINTSDLKVATDATAASSYPCSIRSAAASVAVYIVHSSNQPEDSVAYAYRSQKQPQVSPVDRCQANIGRPGMYHCGAVPVQRCFGDQGCAPSTNENTQRCPRRRVKPRRTPVPGRSTWASVHS